jgi:alpha-D-xyloside xylohydrolase
MVHSGKTTKELATRGAPLAPSTSIQLIAAERAVSPERLGDFVRRMWLAVVLIGAIMLPLGSVSAQDTQLVLDRNGSTYVLEPYAPNIIRVSLSKLKDQAATRPGYGFVATPSAQEWTHRQSGQDEVYRSSRLEVRVAHPPKHIPMQIDIEDARFFGDDPFAPANPHLTVSTPQGKVLLEMSSWSMTEPTYDDGNAFILNDKRPTDAPFYRVSATFVSPNDEHYYGLGQQLQGFFDLRGHKVEAWHDYDATGGESVGVPFIVTNHGYGLVWDNPSRTTLEAGFNEETKWTSEVGDRVSFFVIAGRTTDEIYSGYRLLTGPTPMLPKAAYGFIQCKQRYLTQAELLGVARGYRERHLPLDMIVVDFLHYTKMGQMDMDPKNWPDPVGMNRELHDMEIQSMISVWPHFVRGSRFYDMLLQKGWFIHLVDGRPTPSLLEQSVGPNLDSTNPEAARWLWDTVRDNLLSKGFDAIWADETEPDVPPNGSYFYIGPGTRYFNVYPLLHTEALYEGFRRDISHRALILARAAYLGAQRNATIFWSSDIHATWDTLKRHIPAGLDFTATGMAYWSNDVGGFLDLPDEHHPEHPPLLDPSDCRDNVRGYDDYPELYTRWFEYGAFLPIMRTHGSRVHNEVWSYGKQAEPILIKYLKMRYQLLPYIYSLGYNTYQTGAPYMRALFMDFPDDPNVAEIGDEYMFGPAFLVAPVTDQGATSRMVYLPAGAVWYNYWTSERLRGGQTIKVQAPIDTLPLFVRAGSIVPMGEPIDSTRQAQKISKVRTYSGADADFTLYQDDGTTYAYEKGDSRITHLHWDNAAHKFTHYGDPAWTARDEEILEVIGK